MKHEIERYLPFPLLMWRALTQPFWNLLARAVDLGLRIYLRKDYGIIENPKAPRAVPPVDELESSSQQAEASGTIPIVTSKTHSQQTAIEDDESCFDRAFKIVIEHEGGYVYDKSDLGGETRFGISRKNHPDVNIRELTLEQAKEIYFEEYWQLAQCEKMPQDVIIAYFDSCVNCGILSTGRVFQAAINVALRHLGEAGIVEDGIVGSKTIQAAHYTSDILCFTFKIERCRYYLNLANRRVTNRRFLRGWLRRALE